MRLYFSVTSRSGNSTTIQQVVGIDRSRRKNKVFVHVVVLGKFTDYYSCLLLTLVTSPMAKVHRNLQTGQS